ncbi:MAG: type I-E CRISPR-associated endoribonuclease Cas2 [Rhodobacteraceae bacterium]|nr:type I-E CRISPR-associated endoribonuclease Cas2 [Paracoccaceae bacterium]
MMVIVVSNVMPRLRGRLATWLVEVRSGVYVGDYSTRTREMIWDQVVANIDTGDAVIVWKSPTDQGYEFATAGTNRRMPVDFDGLSLVSFYPEKPVRPSVS